jgi:hypothetical protein
MPLKRADSPASSARFVGRRYRDELDDNEHDAVKHLRQHGFESSEKSCTAIADEQNQDELRHEAHAVRTITWFSFHIHKARGVRAHWSNSTRPSSELTVLFPAPNGVR